MLSFILKRLGQGLVVLLVLYTVTFILVRSLPGGPFLEEKEIPKHIREKKLEQYGLNDPLPKQFKDNFLRLCKGDLGFSTMMEGRNVSEIIKGSFPVSFQLGVTAMLIAMFIGFPAGIISAAYKNSFLDYSTMALAMLGICIPSFVIGPALATWLGQLLGLFPAAGWRSFFSWSWVLPSVTLGLINAAYLSRLTRAGMLDVLGQDYIRTAKAKGLSQKTILLKHSLRGGLIPSVAFIGPAFAAAVSGSIVIEMIFALPGMGQQFIRAINKNDAFVLQGIVLLYGSLIIIANLATDILQVFLNPRLRSKAS